MIFNQSNQDSAEDVFIFPASFAQQRLWFIDQLLPGNALYTIPLIFRLNGQLYRSHLQQSIQAIADRHEILRTTFEVVDGQLVQVITPALPVSLPWIDLRQLPSDICENTVLEQIEQVVQQPFHFNTGPLFRVQLWQLQDTQHVLLLAFHHIIFDEWSSGVLIRELGEHYAALVDHRSPTCSTLPIQYADFAHWQREWLQGEVLHSQLRYWKQQLQDVPMMHLPGATQRSSLNPLAQEHQGASQLVEFPQQLLNALEKLSQDIDVTLFMTLLAAFQVLLHHYTGQTDIAIGSPIANRHRSELEGLIGFLVNSLVLRTDLTGDPPFRELLTRVRTVTLAAYDHQDLPFEKLVEELQPVRSLGQNPLFQVVFALQNTPMETLDLPGLVLSPMELETKTARFDLECYLWKCADNFRDLWGKGWRETDGLRGIIVYNTEIFDNSTISALLDHFQTLLEGIVNNPDQRLSQFSLLTKEEQETLLQHWCGHHSKYPSETCIHQLFDLQVQQRPNARAIQFGHQSFTYQQLNQGSNQLARYLRRLGIAGGKPVGIWLERGSEAIAAMLAVLKAGGAYVPIEPTVPLERLRFMVQDTGMTVLLTQTNQVQELSVDHLFEHLNVICLEQEWDTISQESDQNLTLEITTTSPAYIIYTSGSTGTPKGVVVPHRAVNRLVCDPNYVQITPGDRVAQVANLAFDAATFEVWGALLNGAELIGINRETTLSPTDFAIELERCNINILFLTTALLNQTVTHIPSAFRSLKYLLFGGEIVSVERVRTLLQQGKPEHLIHVYGPTENTTFSTWYEVQEIPENASTIPIGQAISNTQVYLLNSQMKPVPANVVGEIYLGGDGLAQGYWHQPELTREKFMPNPFAGKAEQSSPSLLYKTGDRALYRTDGNLEFLGRTDHQIKLRGFRIEVGEIEVTLLQHPALQSAVVMVQDIDGDRQLVAYVVPHPFAMPSERELRSFLKAKLPAYMIPAFFIPLASLPLTPNGKVDARALPPPNYNSTTRSSVPPPPTTSLEATLIDLWSQLLGRSPIGIHDNFFELGGHSLLATQLVSRIRDRFQVELPLRTLFETPTITALARHLMTLKNGLTQDAHASIETQQSQIQQREEIEL